MKHSEDVIKLIHSGQLPLKADNDLRFNAVYLLVLNLVGSFTLHKLHAKN